MHMPLKGFPFHSQVYRTLWKMCDYGAPTEKPHYGYSNSPAVSQLDLGGEGNRKRKRDEEGLPRVETCRTYKNKDGKPCFVGTPALTKTQRLGCSNNFSKIMNVV